MPPLAVLAWLAGGPVLAQTGTAQVDRVIDGDTIRVRLDGDRFTVRLTGVDTPETIHPTREVEPDDPEAAAYTTARAADARELKRRVGIKGWAARVGYPALVVTFYWDQEPPPNEPAVIREAIDVIRADELQAAILRGADNDGPCTIVILNTVHPLTGRVHRVR